MSIASNQLASMLQKLSQVSIIFLDWFSELNVSGVEADMLAELRRDWPEHGALFPGAGRIYLGWNE